MTFREFALVNQEDVRVMRSSTVVRLMILLLRVEFSDYDISMFQPILTE